jgi:hypothetical protein
MHSEVIWKIGCMVRGSGECLRKAEKGKTFQL